MLSPPMANRAERISRRGPLRLPPRAAVLFALALLAACAAPQAERVLEAPGDLPPKVELAEVPFFPQEAYQCGPASLAMALTSSGVLVRPDDLVAKVYSPARKGSLPPEMVSASRRHGRVAYPVSTLEDLLAELAAGNPVVVLQNLGFSWYPRWHFAVVIGYDLPKEELVLHSGTEPREVLSLRHFERTWEMGGHWGLVVLPPSVLPARAKESAFVEAVIGLERARQWEAAIEAYRAALARWPASLGALMGLGNSRYVLGNLAGAERAFREAARAHRSAAPAFNNLAHVLAETGRREEAEAAARSAVALGGPLAHVYQATLEKIRGAQRRHAVIRR